MFGSAGGEPPPIDVHRLIDESKAVIGVDLWNISAPTEACTMRSRKSEDPTLLLAIAALVASAATARVLSALRLSGHEPSSRIALVGLAAGALVLAALLAIRAVITRRTLRSRT